MSEKYRIIPNPHTHAILDVETGEILLRQTYSNCLAEKKRLELFSEEPKRDVHTEHCCKNCGCKYGDKDCTVVLNIKEQTYNCGPSCNC